MKGFLGAFAFYLRSNLRGQDFFISYSRADATPYALALAQRLDKEELTCYIDQWGSLPGEKVPASLLQKLSRCQVLLVIGSPHALTSEPMRTEIALFAKTGRPIVPIVFGSIQQAVWSKEIQGLAMAIESVEALGIAQPSEPIIARAKSSLTYARQDKRIKRAIWITAVLILILGSLIAYVSRNLNNTLRKVAEGEEKIARTEKTLTRTRNLTAQARKSEQQAIQDLTRVKADNYTAKAQLIATKQAATRIRAALNNSRNLLGAATHRLVIERDCVAVAKRKGDQYFAAARKRAEDATEMLAYMDKGLSEVFQHPTLSHCKLENLVVKPYIIYINNDKHQIKDKTVLAKLDTLAACLKGNPAYSVKINGHTANEKWINEGKSLGNGDAPLIKYRPTDEYDMGYGLDIAGAVFRYLKKKGVPDSIMTTGSYGHRRPLYSLGLLNNRAEVWLVRK